MAYLKLNKKHRTRIMLLMLAISALQLCASKTYAEDCDIGQARSGVEYLYNYWEDGKMLYSKTYIIPVANPEAVNAYSTINNLIINKTLNRRVAARVLNDNPKIVIAKDSAGAERELEIETPAERSQRCYNYKDGTVTVYELFKWVNDVRRGRIKAIGISVEKYTFPIKQKYNGSF